MKTITKTMLDEIYEQSVTIARSKNQAIHDEKDTNDGAYYITLAQLEGILQIFES